MTPQVERFVDAAARVVIYAFALVSLEWAFFWTTPSFLSAASPLQAVAAMLAAGLAFALGALLLFLPFAGAAAVVARGGDARTRLRDLLLRAVPSLLFAVLALLLLDNFTYTTIRFGVVSTDAFTIPVYLAFLGWVFVKHVRRVPPPGPGGHLTRRNAATVLLCAGAAGATIAAVSGGTVEEKIVRTDPGRKLPNIVIFGVDGVDATRVSAYGYERETTPNLARWMDRAFVAENAFTNSGWTTGALTSLLTGKAPATTKVLYPPYTLQGRDALEHLPGILQELGYHNVQETIRYYADAPDLGFRKSFAAANGRDVPRDAEPAGVSLPPGLELARQLFERVSQRIRERLLHLTFVQPMVNVHRVVMDPDVAKVYGISDRERIRRVVAAIESDKRPFFAHLHLLDTHCCTFRPEKRVFSAGTFENADEKRNAELDDAIADADRKFGELMDLLEKKGLLGETVVVFLSDHGAHWNFRGRVPLVFLFPDGTKGRVRANAQLLDVAPTLLDHLGVKKPTWMEGVSLLAGEPDPMRPVFAIDQLARDHFQTNRHDKLAHVVSVGPPTYGLTRMGTVICNRWYSVQIDGQAEAGPVAGHTAPCDKETLPGILETANAMRAHLQARGVTF